MSAEPIHELPRLLRELRPVLHEGRFAFATLPEGVELPPAAVGWFREREGTTVILPLEAARAAGLPVAFACAWITLEVPSALEAVGLTAAVARALTDEGIACNVVAARHHDHLFVPERDGARALAALRALQAALHDD